VSHELAILVDVCVEDRHLGTVGVGCWRQGQLQIAVLLLCLDADDAALREGQAERNVLGVIADGRALIELELVDVLADLLDARQHRLVHQRNHPFATNLEDLVDEREPGLAAEHWLLDGTQLRKEVENASLGVRREPVGWIDIVKDTLDELAQQLSAFDSNRR
jgi:hypothetical protein